MSISFDTLILGEEYDRPYLAKLWGYKSWHAIGRGIITPKEQALIILFVTKEKQKSLTQYEDRFIGEKLAMEGETGHRSDERIIASQQGSDRIFLFYRSKHHMPFIYYGEVWLEQYVLKVEQPSLFYFSIGHSLSTATSSIIKESVASGVEDETYIPEVEGQKKITTHVQFERSRKNRAKAIEIHGGTCKVCGFDFDSFYGPELAHGFIEVHHVESITTEARVVEPANDLIPLCANCHRMVHRKRGKILPIEELIQAVKSAASNQDRITSKG